MSRLVVVSNRVPAPDGEGTGGLAVALKAALTERGGLWFGWSGDKAADDATADTVRSVRSGGIEFALVDLTERDINEYYTGFANRALWPLLHYRLDLTDFDRRDTSAYFRVNALFARKLVERLNADDVIWVQDYHLIPLATELRALGVRNRIGFFLHIPWPPPDIWFALPVYRRLLEALTAYDLVGFQTHHDADYFVAAIERAGIGSRVSPAVVAAGERRFQVGTYPIGIETEAFAALARRAAEGAVVKRMHASLDGRALIIGVDRLDYSKGIDHRMLAYERFLTKNEGYRKKVVFLQVTPKSRSEVPEYAAMQTQLAQTAGRINGAYGDVDWTPIRYVNRAIRRSTLAGLYRFGNVALVTPLRDGMNLVAKEFVAAQNPDNPGALVLSRFAGAAQELAGALIVNPYDLENTGEAIARAVAMGREERIARWQPMFEHLMENDVDRWRDDFLNALETWPTADDQAMAS
jgi:trehalose 6-phosphate synthase